MASKSKATHIFIPLYNQLQVDKEALSFEAQLRSTPGGVWKGLRLPLTPA